MQDIIATNKLIADFMGILVTHFNEEIGYAICDEEGTVDLKWGIDWYCPNSQWEQLMPVWGKLRTTVWSDNDQSYPSEFCSFIEEWKRGCFNAVITECYTVVANAIIWYNSNKKQ